MLDHLSEVAPEAQPKRAAPAGGVQDSNRHLSYEDLEAYVDGRLPPARLKHCGTHLDSCDACRAELEDLRSIKGGSPALQRAEAQRRDVPQRRRRRGVMLHAVAAGTTVVVVAVCAYFWWAHQKTRATKPAVAHTVTQSAAPVAMAVPHSPAPVAVPHSPAPVAMAVAQSAAPAAMRLNQAAAPAARAAQVRGSSIAEDIADLPEDMRAAVSAAIQHRKLQLPAEPGLFRDRAPAVAAAPETNTAVVLLGPRGEAISETRPEFRWQPFAGAVRYSVTIVDATLHPVQHSPALRTTAWRPKRPLHRGQTYLWQVKASVRGRSKAASSATALPAVVRVIPEKLADEIAHFRQQHETAHLVLGVLYGQAGMLTASADELGKVAPTDPDYSTARALWGSLPAIAVAKPLNPQSPASSNSTAMPSSPKS